jgi:hypothetical protein
MQPLVHKVVPSMHSPSLQTALPALDDTTQMGFGKRAVGMIYGLPFYDLILLLALLKQHLLKYILLLATYTY